MGIFSGLEKFGLSPNKDMKVYDTEKNQGKQELSGEQSQPKPKESDFLFDKSYTCPICDTTFTTRPVRTGKAKMISHDFDLRPRYLHIDVLKYDAVVCPVCGFAALNTCFKPLSATPTKWIKEQISMNFVGFSIPKDVYSYDDAIAMHKLALLSTVVKRGRTSERAYCCLKLAWLNRGKREESQDEKERKQLKQEELELISQAFEGFSEAYIQEDFPICGMNQVTISFLVAGLARQLRQYDTALQWLYKVISSVGVNERIKCQARTMKDQIFEEKKIWESGGVT